MTWPETIAFIDQLHVENEPPPQEMRERAKRLADKWQADGVSPPGKVGMSSSGDVEFRWRFPDHDMLCSLWIEGCGIWRLVFERGQAEITSWPVEE